MKDTHVLAAACSLALIAIVGVFIGYATDTLPQQQQRVIITADPSPEETVSVSNPIEKKKDCDCCKDRMAALIKSFKKNQVLEDVKTNTSE